MEPIPLQQNHRQSHPPKSITRTNTELRTTSRKITQNETQNQNTGTPTTRIRLLQKQTINEQKRYTPIHSDRLLEIDYQNEILLSKMNKISKAVYVTNKLRPEAQQLKTLNKHIMNVQAD